MTAPPRISTEKLCRSLPSGNRQLTILDEVDLEVRAGEFVAILGPSGSGKSTLLALLAGLDRPTSGSVRIDGRALEALSEDELARLRRDKIGFVFQAFQLLGNLTALENVLLPIEIKRTDASFLERQQQAMQLLERVGLGDRSHHYPVQLSGGEQQRVALARAFATKPALLLADEPTGNLDTNTGARVLETLLELRQQEETTLVLVTHDDAVARLADRLVYLRDGRIDHERAPA